MLGGVNVARPLSVATVGVIAPRPTHVATVGVIAPRGYRRAPLNPSFRSEGIRASAMPSSLQSG